MQTMNSYLKAAIAGLIIFSVELLILLTPLDQVLYGLLHMIPCLMAITYAGITGLLPGLTCAGIWTLLYLLISCSICHIPELSTFILKYLYIIIAGVCCAVSGALTTITKRQWLGIAVGFAGFTVTMLLH